MIKRQESNSTVVGSRPANEGSLVWDDEAAGLRFRAQSNFEPLADIQTAPPLFKIDFQKIVDAYQGVLYSDSDILSMSHEELLSVAISDKQSSLAVQVSIEFLGTIAFGCLVGFAADNLHTLLFDPFGSYIVQRLVRHSAWFQQKVVSFASANILTASTDEYSSRVLELLATINKWFRSFCLLYFRDNLPALLTSFPTVFILSAAIANTEDESERDIVSQYLHKEGLKKCKYFKRLLVMYLTHCSKANLHRLGLLLSFKTKTKFYLQDRYSIQILVASATRGCIVATDAISVVLTDSVYSAVGLKYFDLFISQMCGKASLPSVLSRILIELQQITEKDWVNLALSAKRYRILSQSYLQLSTAIRSLCLENNGL